MAAKQTVKPARADAGGASARGRILSAAFSAFTERGFAETSTLEIATRARVSKRELYALFGSKQDMLIACIGERAKRFKVPADLPELRRSRDVPEDACGVRRAVATRDQRPHRCRGISLGDLRSNARAGSGADAERDRHRDQPRRAARIDEPGTGRKPARWRSGRDGRSICRVVVGRLDARPSAFDRSQAKSARDRTARGSGGRGVPARLSRTDVGLPTGA